MYVVACYDSNELFYRHCITRSKVASPQYKITRCKVAQFFSVKLTESPPSTPGENKKETMKKKISSRSNSNYRRCGLVSQIIIAYGWFLKEPSEIKSTCKKV